MDGLYTGGILQDIDTRDCLITWSASIYNIRLGSQVHNSLLEEFPESYGDTVDHEYRVSSVGKRSVRKDHPCFRGHATGMCYRSQG